MKLYGVKNTKEITPEIYIYHGSILALANSKRLFKNKFSATRVSSNAVSKSIVQLIGGSSAASSNSSLKVHTVGL